MIGAPNSLNLNWKVRVIKEAPGPSVSEEVADIFRNYNINNNGNDNDDDDGNNDNNKNNNNNNDNNDNNDSNDNDNENNNNNNNNACKLWLKSRHTLCKLGTVKWVSSFTFILSTVLAEPVQKQCSMGSTGIMWLNLCRMRTAPSFVSIAISRSSCTLSRAF